MNHTKQQPIVVKIGGALLAQADALSSFWNAVQQLRTQAPVVIVHGGGAQATELANRMGHDPHIVHGRRVTSDLDLEIVQWTLRGTLNTKLVTQAMQHGLSAVGISGADGGLLRVTKRPPWNIDGEMVDFGWVGDVESVHPEVLEGLLEHGFVPIIAPLGVDASGQVYNVNADTTARAIAEALGASQLFFVTEAGNLKRDVQQDDSHLEQCDIATFETGTTEGWIHGGMRVKLQMAFEALDAGIADVFILAPDDLAARTQATQVVL